MPVARKVEWRPKRAAVSKTTKDGQKWAEALEPRPEVPLLRRRVGPVPYSDRCSELSKSDANRIQYKMLQGLQEAR